MFGSVARGEAKQDSDVDLMVRLNKPIGLNFFECEQKLSEAIRKNVEMVSENAVKSHYLEYIKEDLVEL